MPKKESLPLRFHIDGIGEVSARPGPDPVVLSVVPGEEIQYFKFDRCPICLSSGSEFSREHVPPIALGGEVRTLTCAPCNNKLGSRVEAEFIAWWKDALCFARFSGPNASVLGHRFVDSVHLRYTEGGQFVLALQGGPRDELVSMLESGELVAEFRLPDENRYRIAALKQVYLAACLLKRSIPMTRGAEAVRAELLSARDASDIQSVPIGEIAAGLQLGRAADRAKETPALTTCVVNNRGSTWHGVLLGGAVAVSWPLLGLDGL